MIYLASTSPRRRKILKGAGIPFKAVKPLYEEKSGPVSAPSRAVRENAMGKALSAAKRIRTGTVVGCDTMIYFGGRAFGKPRSRREAFRMLACLQGKSHSVYSGVAILAVRKGQILRKRVFFEKTIVALNRMNRRSLAEYFRRVNPLDKAGAYAIQSPGTGLVRKIRGSFYNVVGLPLETLRRYL